MLVSISGIDTKPAKPTISDVARYARVSTSSVSRYLKGERVGAAKQIEEAIELLRYRPSAVARSLKSGRTHTLGLVVPDVTNPFFAGVAKGVEAVAGQAGYTVLLSNTDETPERERRVLSTLTDRIDGLLLAPAREDIAADPIRSLDVPVVFIDRAVPEMADVDVVLVDNVGGAAAAARHLIELGHRRIGFISGPLDTTPGRERHEGFTDECARHRDVAPMIELGDFKEESGYQATLRLLGRSDPPTAIFAANNLMTVGMLRGVRDLGIPVPDGVSLVGFDDHTLADLIDPPLTVVDRPTDVQGAVATRLLLARLGGTADEPARQIRLETQLVVRSSTAHPVGNSFAPRTGNETALP